MFVDLPPSLSLIKSGKIRVLAVATPQRLAILPDVPTVGEAGFPFEAYAWQGLVGPAKMTAAVVDRLSKDLLIALKDPTVRGKLGKLGIEPMTMTPQQFAEFTRREQKLWAGVIEAANILLDRQHEKVRNPS